jgi:hypothetical protein
MRSSWAHLRTGMETHKLYYCERCDWQTTARREPWATISWCPECHRPLSFMRLSKDEKAKAEEIVGRQIEFEDA